LHDNGAPVRATSGCFEHVACFVADLPAVLLTLLLRARATREREKRCRGSAEHSGEKDRLIE
jgi:hypothetical protein